MKRLRGCEERYAPGPVPPQLGGRREPAPSRLLGGPAPLGPPTRSRKEAAAAAAKGLR